MKIRLTQPQFELEAWAELGNIYSRSEVSVKEVPDSHLNKGDAAYAVWVA